VSAECWRLAPCRTSSSRTADHEEDLLGHPYIGGEHLELGRLFWFHTGDVAKA